MILSASVRKALLSVHLTLAVGWIGSVMAYIALGIAAISSGSVSTIRAAWTGMDLVGWYAIVPLAIASLASGIVIALGTKWGLFRHYWVVISLVITLVSTVVLLLHMPSVSTFAQQAQRSTGRSLDALGGDLFHPIVGLVLLLVVQVLNLYKPRGLTRYGWRKQQTRQPGQTLQ